MDGELELNKDENYNIFLQHENYNFFMVMVVFFLPAMDELN